MFESRIQGIPCQIEITLFRDEGITTNGNQAADEFEYEVYDRKGYKADWLARKITDEDELRIYKDMQSHMREMQ